VSLALALVDDDPGIRRVMSLLLTEEGWAVTAFESAESALPPLLRGDFAALITDHVLPGMHGLDLARQLRAAHPATPCVVISGYSAPEGCDLPWLCKPVDFDTLLRAITPT
jgi:DNA-binding NtrC family response regulator